jgi:hypothetical protein
MPEPRDIGVDQDKEEQVLYYFLAPDGRVYENPDNHPVESLNKAMKQEGSYVRFAYNKDLNLLFFQDQSEVEPSIRERDPSVLSQINTIISFIQETFSSPYPKLGNGTGYGEPPSSCQARRLSDYQVAWVYLSKYLSSEFKRTRMERFSTPVDINIAEYYEARSDGDKNHVKSFHPNGLSFMNKTFHGPTMVINKAPAKAGEPIDYGNLSLFIVTWYLLHFQEITGSVLAPYEKAYLALNIGNLRINEFGYDVFYSAYDPSTGKTPVYPYATKTNETISEDEARRDLSRKIAENLQKQGKPIPEGQLYTAPVVVFSYLPYRKQIVWQSVDPSMVSDEITSKMCDGARKQIQAWYGIDSNEVNESYDPSSHLPNLAKISHYHVAWQYITDIMAPRYGFIPEEYDIEVLECPKPVGDAIAAYFSSPQEEEDRGSNVREMRISFGITVKFPFIAQNSLNKDYGLSLNALIHEYEHYINDVFLKKKERVPFKDFNDRNVSDEERARRFFSYIASQKEHDAHVEQMVYMLHMGMTDRDIIDTFAPMHLMAWRAEYRLILGEAKKIFEKDREKKKIPKQYVSPKPAMPEKPEEDIVRAKEPQESQVQQEKNPAADVEATGTKPIKLSELDIGVNNWFWEGLQEVINRPRHVNIKPEQGQDDTFNLSKLRHQPHIEKALDDDRDKDSGFLKSLEQLLRESQL